MTNTTERGDHFSDAVASLLRTKYESVRREVRICNKAVDIYLEHYHFGDTIKVAIECKYYAKPINSKVLWERIFSHYRPMVESREVDLVVVIANKEPRASIRSTLDSYKGFRIQTLEQLQEEIIGLRPYIRALKNVFDEDSFGLPSHYVPARFQDESSISVDFLDDWLDDKMNQGLAILGGYGSGKSSLSKYYASYRAQQFLQNSQARMPILINIGSELYETKLEGIFGKLFLSRYPGNSFNFDAMMKLNEEGRLLIMFDGFDEMKHAMTSADFRANFTEINRLLKGNAKVILLGRPNALTSDDRKLVFRGLRDYENTEIRDPYWPVWREVNLDRLSLSDIRLVLAGVICLNNPEYHQIEISKKVERIVESVDVEILSRPIQARLVATISADAKVQLNGLRLYHVYHYFVKYLLERDAERPARRAVSVTDRKEFQERLAFWVWCQKGSLFRREDLPDTLFRGLSIGMAVDRVSRNNEFIVSTLTEEKDHGVLYFSHRSIQEFLVSQYFLPKSTLHSLSRIEEFVNHFDTLSLEIKFFLAESENITFFRVLWEHIASDHYQARNNSKKIVSFLTTIPFFLKNFISHICASDAFKNGTLRPQPSLEVLFFLLGRDDFSPRQKAELLIRGESIRLTLAAEQLDEIAISFLCLLRAGLTRNSTDEFAICIALRLARNKKNQQPTMKGSSRKGSLRIFEDLLSNSVSLTDSYITVSNVQRIVTLLFGAAADNRNRVIRQWCEEVFQGISSGLVQDVISVQATEFSFASDLGPLGLSDIYSELQLLERKDKPSATPES